MWPHLETDVLGDLATVDIDGSVYSDTAMFKTAYWMTDRFYLFLDRNSSSSLRVEIRNKPSQNVDLQQACAEFCNALIDFKVRDIVNQETRGLREALVQKTTVIRGISVACELGAADTRIPWGRS